MKTLVNQCCSANKRGTTLLETVISLGILGILAATIAPMAFNLVEADRQRATERKAERIFRAIYGAPERGDFGYLGDMGRLPTTLTELLVQGTQTAFHATDGATDHIGRVGTGWRGPYLRGFSQDELLKDAWGNDFLYSNTGPNAGKIISPGPDGNINTAENNIVFPANLPGATGTLFVSLLINQIPQPKGAVVRLYSSSNGEQVLLGRKTTSDAGFDGFFFQNVPQGLHALRVAHITPGGGGGCTTVTREVTAQVVANQQVVHEVRILSDGTVLSMGSSGGCEIPGSL